MRLGFIGILLIFLGLPLHAGDKKIILHSQTPAQALFYQKEKIEKNTYPYVDEEKEVSLEFGKALAEMKPMQVIATFESVGERLGALLTSWEQAQTQETRGSSTNFQIDAEALSLFTTLRGLALLMAYPGASGNIGALQVTALEKLPPKERLQTLKSERVKTFRKLVLSAGMVAGGILLPVGGTTIAAVKFLMVFGGVTATSWHGLAGGILQFGGEIKTGENFHLALSAMRRGLEKSGFSLEDLDARLKSIDKILSANVELGKGAISQFLPLLACDLAVNKRHEKLLASPTDAQKLLKP